MKETRISFSKFEQDKQVAYGEVYVPYVPDSQGDYMTPEEIERVAHNFLRNGKLDSIDTEHNLKKNGARVIESFIAREGDSDFAAGSWVLGVHIPDTETWKMVKSGDISGFSMYGTGRRKQQVVEIEVPDDGVLFGKTADYEDHHHMYALDFDEKGNFLGGETDTVNGHTHTITKGTVTDAHAGHRHRFSFMETLSKGCGELSDAQKEWKKKRKKKRG